MRLRTAAFAAIGIALCLAAAVKPALVTTDQGSRVWLLFRWQSGQVRFTNSVTLEPVEIRFRIGGRFEAFSVATGPQTEAYYTAGAYSLNAAAAAESPAALRWCSIKGISLRLGFYNIELTDGCLEVRLLWTI